MLKPGDRFPVSFFYPPRIILVFHRPIHRGSYDGRRTAKAGLLRNKISRLLADPDSWHDYEPHRHFLEKLLQYDGPYTEAQIEAVEGINHARRFLIKQWAGYTVPELIREASKYLADFGYDDELFLNEIRDARRLTRGDMNTLVSMARYAGVDIPRFAE